MDTNSHIEKQETVLWSGRPKKGIYLLYFVEYSLLFVPFLFGLMGIEMIRTGVSIVLGIVMACLGFGWCVFKLVNDRKRRNSTVYEVTEDYLVIHRKPSFLTDAITRFPINSLPNIFPDHYADGTGSLFFYDRSNPSGSHNVRPELIFERILDSKVVEALIRNLQAKVIS